MTWSLTWTVLIIAVLVASVDYAMAIQCYWCSKDCNEPNDVKDCSTYGDRSFDHCKTIIFSNGQVSRGCAFADECNPNSRVHVVDCSVCNTDLCNNKIVHPETTPKPVPNATTLPSTSAQHTAVLVVLSILLQLRRLT